ncbi:MAG: nicotinate phosphoribosyltransferase [Woeseia sp.]
MKNANQSALFTDLYELTMLQAYFTQHMTEQATFSLFARRLPPRRNFLLACGLDSVLEYLDKLRFTDGDLDYLRSLDKFSGPFLDWLQDFSFTGEVRAVAEGTPVFANEPILEVTAPLPEAQVAETFIMNQIHVQTVLATKAQRIVAAAKGRPVVDFGARRMHGTDAALKAARAFYIAGVAATSNVLAGQRYGLPLSGTMAHSYVQAHESEEQAFLEFARLYPDTVLLVDTYDTLAGVRKVISLASRLGKQFRVKSLRLDSGDLLALSKEARQLLDAAGLQGIGLFASGGLDEDAIGALLAANAPIDGFGVGTSMGVSNDAPDLDIVYKMCAYAGSGRLKLSTGKPVLPGSKQVFRLADGDRDVRDVIARAGEDLPGRPLLTCVMRNGKRLDTGAADLDTARRRAGEQIARLPDGVQAISPAASAFPVEISAALAGYRDEVAAVVRSQQDIRKS